MLIVSILYFKWGSFLYWTFYKSSLLAGMLQEFLPPSYEVDAPMDRAIPVWFASSFFCIASWLLSTIGIMGLMNYVSPWIHEHHTALMFHWARNATVMDFTSFSSGHQLF
jgi:hypothetical protein